MSHHVVTRLLCARGSETVGFSSVDRVRVRELVNHRDMGVHVGSMVVSPLPTHGSTLFNVSVVWGSH